MTKTPAICLDGAGGWLLGTPDQTHYAQSSIEIPNLSAGLLLQNKALVIARNIEYLTLLANYIQPIHYIVRNPYGEVGLDHEEY